MKIKEATNREVHWQFPKLNIGDQANDRVLGRLGDELRACFAPVYAGNSGSFQWHSPDAGWNSLPAAAADVQEQVRAEWVNVQNGVREKFSAEPDIAERLLTIPNEEYIFYKTSSDGTLKLLVTGWGFQNFRRPDIVAPKPEPIDRITQSVCIHVTRDGEPVGNTEVVIPTKNGLNALYTGEDGVLRMPTNLSVGQRFTLQHPDSGAEKQFVVVKGQTEYEWDVTQTTQISVRATLDDKPLADTSVVVTYHGRDYKLVLDDGGTACIDAMAYHPGDVCQVVLGGDQSQERELEVNANNIFDFDVKSPVPTPPPAPDSESVPPEVPELNPPTPPELREFRLTVLDHAGKPYVGMNIALRQGAHVVPARLDEHGTTMIERRNFADYEPIDVQLNSPAQKFPPIGFTLEPEEDEYVIQEQLETPSPWESVLMQLLIVFLAAIFLTVIGYLMIHFFM